MIYSVWNPAARAFDYYVSPEVQPTHTPAARHVPASGLGATPEETAWPLPPTARKVGAGPQAQGRIATMSGFETARGNLTIAAVLVAAYFIGKKILR